MKKVILLIIILIFLTGCGIFDLNNFIISDYTEFMNIVESLDTPQKIGNYMEDNFTYEVHDFYVPDPYILWKTKKGNCIDFGTFGIFIANYHGYETFQITIFDDTLYQHFVAVYNENIWYSITDNQYYSFGYDSFEEITEYVCDIRNKIWTKYIVCDYWNNEKEIVYNN